MDKTIISDGSLQSFINRAPISEEDRFKLLKDLPYMDEESRIFLLKALKEIFIIEENKEEAIKRIKENF